MWTLRAQTSSSLKCKKNIGSYESGEGGPRLSSSARLEEEKDEEKDSSINNGREDGTVSPPPSTPLTADLLLLPPPLTLNLTENIKLSQKIKYHPKVEKVKIQL